MRFGNTRGRYFCNKYGVHKGLYHTIEVNFSDLLKLDEHCREIEFPEVRFSANCTLEETVFTLAIEDDEGEQLSAKVN